MQGVGYDSETEYTCISMAEVAFRGPCTLAAIEVNILEVLNFLASLKIT